MECNERSIFTINQSAVGEGMIARNTSDNLLAIICFYQETEYLTALSQNITSSERYALDRSWLINGKLTQEENLKTQLQSHLIIAIIWQ